MKVLLTTLNAKYIHTSLALRWLYVANKDKFDISFKEYVIKEEITTIEKNNVVIAHCPTSNVNLSSGIASISKLLKKNTYLEELLTN